MIVGTSLDLWLVISGTELSACWWTRFPFGYIWVGSQSLGFPQIFGQTQLNLNGDWKWQAITSSLNCRSQGPREGQVVYPKGTTLGSKDSAWTMDFFLRRQGRSFRSGTSLNLTEPDDDDDRVMAKRSEVELRGLSIGECRVCISQSTLVLLEFVWGVSTCFNIRSCCIGLIILVKRWLCWHVGMLGIMNRCKVNGVVQRGCAWGTWFAWEKGPSLNLQAIYLAFRMGKCDQINV